MKIQQRKMQLKLDPSRPWKETVVYINYDSTDRRTETYSRKIPEKRFYIDLPQVIADSLGYETSRGNTQEEAFEEFEADLERFRNLKTERSRVILYEIKIDPDPDESSHFVSGYSVKVWAGTYEETIAISGNDDRRYSYEPIESALKFPGDPPFSFRRGGGERQKCQIPWSKQNEAFFTWVDWRMVGLVARLAEIRSPDQLIESINAGRLLPLGQQDMKS